MKTAITQVFPGDKRTLASVDALLHREGITRDANLDYIGAMLDEEGEVIATGSCFGNTLRCFAVSSDHQGEGLLNRDRLPSDGVPARAGATVTCFSIPRSRPPRYLESLGFYEIARVEGTLVFMENRRNGFPNYLKALEKTARPNVSAAIVMNANPFTLGHRYLVEARREAVRYPAPFRLSEDASLVPFIVRKELVRQGTADLPNVVIHDSGPYIISNATFPSYFLKDEAAVIQGHARLDLAVFVRIAKALGVTTRFVGEEPNSQVTGIYNRIMAQALPEQGIALPDHPEIGAGRQGHQRLHRPRRPEGWGLGDPENPGARSHLRLFPLPGGQARAGGHPQGGECGALLT